MNKQTFWQRFFGDHKSAWTVAIFWILALAIVAGISLSVRAYAVQAFYIKSSSMLPTLEANDRVFVNKLSYKAHQVNRGDVVVISRSSAFGDAYEQTDDLIKRVIGLEGETLRIQNCMVTINGQELLEPYLMEYDPNGAFYIQECRKKSDFEVTIPEGHIFVMGDNRLNSIDSRIFGVIPEDSIVGRAFIKVWPFWEFSSL